ncbi:MAG TPA: PEP-CTERM sorting domain-containing protein [Acidobacteriaceae bacterium]|jgi:hypothetical protein|nr:PEP-CTERM sorting domain-containing protein [Acidobacteriaceae bacterium]
MNSKRIKSVVMTAAFLLGATSAFADTFNSTLTTGNSDISGHAGPYGTVLVTTTGTNTATITFTADAGFLFAAQGATAVELNSTNFTINSFTGTSPTGFSGPSLQNAGAGQEDGFGNFNQTFDEFDGYGYALNTMTFTVTNSGTSWAGLAANVLGLDANGFDAAAHIFVCNTNPCSTLANGGSATVTGYAGEGGGVITNPTPEPASLGLLGTGLLAVSGMVVRRRWRTAV